MCPGACATKAGGRTKGSHGLDRVLLFPRMVEGEVATKLGVVRTMGIDEGTGLDAHDMQDATKMYTDL